MGRGEEEEEEGWKGVAEVVLCMIVMGKVMAMGTQACGAVIAMGVNGVTACVEDCQGN